MNAREFAEANSRAFYCSSPNFEVVFKRLFDLSISQICDIVSVVPAVQIIQLRTNHLRQLRIYTSRHRPKES